MASRIIVLAQEEDPNIEVAAEPSGDQELPESFGTRVGVIGIMNFMKKVRYSNSGLNVESIGDLVENTPEMTQYNLKDPTLDQAIQSGGSARNTLRVTMFQDLFQKLATSGQYEPALVAQEGAIAAMFVPEPGEGTDGGQAPYDSLWKLVGQKFGVIVQEQQLQRRQQQAPPLPVGQVKAMKTAQALPPAVPQAAPQDPGQAVGVQDSPLGKKYESLNDLKTDLVARGPNEQTYNDLFEMVGPDNEDAAREALSSFFQGSATAIGTLYGMLIAAGKAEPIDSEVVGEIMEQHPELGSKDETQASSEAGCKYAGLFLPAASGTMTKVADSAAFPHYPPADAALRMCPKTRGLVPLEICRFHCLDGLVVDDTQVLCGEAIWRQNVMDKFSREYRDKDGNWVGGYLNKRFKTEQDDGGHPALLKPGQRSAPIHEDAWSTEKRLQELRKSEGSARNYSETNGDPKDLYAFDPHAEDKGPKNPQAFEKKTDPKSRTAAFNLRQYRLAAKNNKTAAVIVANPVIDPANEDMSPKVKVCPKCKKMCANDAAVCDMCQCPLKGNPNAEQMNSQQMQGQTGSIGQPSQIMAGVVVTEDLGLFKASASGLSSYGMTSNEAIEKLAQALADLGPESIEDQNEQLDNLMQPQGPSQQPAGLPGQPEARPHGDQPPDAARVDMTPSTPGLPAVEDPSVEIQGGRSEFTGEPEKDGQPGPQAAPEGAETEVGDALVGKTFPLTGNGWDAGEDATHIDAGNLDTHLETEVQGRHPTETQEIHDQAAAMGAVPAH